MAKFEGQLTVMKSAKQRCHQKEFREEVNFLKELNGAGGAPKLVATTQEDPLFLMTFIKGTTLLEYKMENQSQPFIIDFLEKLIFKL